MSALTQLASLQQGLDDLRSASMGIHQFSQLARQCPDLLTALPPRYGEVLLGLLDRLESSALFSEESCSFSHADLHDSLQMWLNKASLQL
jgi:hypothetical protein